MAFPRRRDDHAADISAGTPAPNGATRRPTSQTGRKGGRYPRQAASVNWVRIVPRIAGESEQPFSAVSFKGATGSRLPGSTTRAMTAH